MAAKTAPLAVGVEVASVVINAVLPIVTTYFAAATTTALAEAFGGDTSAGQRVLYYVIITAALGVVSAMWFTVSNYANQMVRYKIESNISDRMYDHFLRLDFWRYDDKETIDIYDKAKQFANLFPYIFSRIADMVSAIFSILVGLIAMVLVNPWFGLIMLVAIIPGIIIQTRVSRAQTNHWKKHIETRRTQNMIEWDILQRPEHMSDLRLYGMARYLLDLRNKLRDRSDKASIEFERHYLGYRLLVNAIVAIAQVVVLVWTVIKITHRSLPIGQFIYVEQLVSRVLSGSTSLVTTLSVVDDNLANLVEYQTFLDMEEATPGTRQLKKSPRLIEVDNVSFSYPYGDPVLHNISFSIRQGQHVAIVGENGAGKTTLIKILSGLYKPTSGSVLLDGTPLDHYDSASWHSFLSVLQQDFLAYGFAKARDNVFYGDVSRPFDQQRFDDALDMSLSREFLEKLPVGIDNYLMTWMEDSDGNKGIDLSGGQWQRLALARNFYRNSPIIILDEPTSAIDALAESRIFEQLFAKKDKTIISISHRLTTVKKADMIIMLKHGRIVETGTHQELVEKKGEYYHVFKSQL